jgi:hypothetical protein
MAGMISLKKLDLSWCFGVSSIAECANMESLEWLGIRACGVTDLKPLTNLTKLAWIDTFLTGVEVEGMGTRNARKVRPNASDLPVDTHIFVETDPYDIYSDEEYFGFEEVRRRRPL